MWTVNKLYSATFEGQDIVASSSKIRDTTAAASRPRAGNSTTTNTKVTVESDNVPNSAKGSLPTPATTPSRSTPVPTQPETSVTQSSAGTSTQQPSSTQPDNQIAAKAANPPAEIPESLVIPIVVKELPLDHPAVLASPPIAGAAGTILKHQPIIHDKAANMLVLSPIVFGTLTNSDITELQNLGARKAIWETVSS